MTIDIRFALAASLLIATAGPVLSQDATRDDRSAQERPAAPNAPVSLPTPTVVLEFTATGLRVDGEVAPAVVDLADAPFVASLEVTGLTAEAAQIEGSLVFGGPAKFLAWREDGMAAFFERLGGVPEQAMTLRVFRPDLVARSSAGGDALGNVSVAYENTGNDAAGDADIDAVTVICPGENADCKPSN